MCVPWLRAVPTWLCTASLQVSRKAPECAPGFRVACNKWLILVRRGKGGGGKTHTIGGGGAWGAVSGGWPLLGEGRVKRCEAVPPHTHYTITVAAGVMSRSTVPHCTTALSASVCLPQPRYVSVCVGVSALQHTLFDSSWLC